MDMLATTHVNRRGVYLWSNSAIYGSGADIRPSELPIDARLPALASGGAIHMPSRCLTNLACKGRTSLRTQKVVVTG